MQSITGSSRLAYQMAPACCRSADMIMHDSWIVAIAILAFIAVGCGAPSPRTVAIARAPTLEMTTPSGNDSPPPPPAPVPARAPAALVAIDPQPAPQSGQVHISGRGFEAGASVAISVGTTADTFATKLS